MGDTWQGAVGIPPRTGVQGDDGVEARAGEARTRRPGRVDRSVHIL